LTITWLSRRLSLSISGARLSTKGVKKRGSAQWYGNIARVTAFEPPNSDGRQLLKK